MLYSWQCQDKSATNGIPVLILASCDFRQRKSSKLATNNFEKQASKQKECILPYLAYDPHKNILWYRHVDDSLIQVATLLDRLASSQPRHCLKYMCKIISQACYEQTAPVSSA